LLTTVLDGLTSHGCFNHCEAVLSGYLGHADAAAVVSDAVERAKAGTPGSVYLCDPVLGDDGRFYVGDEIVAAMHNLAAKADILTPNAFELGVLSGTDCRTRADALRAMRALQSRVPKNTGPESGPKTVLLTSFSGSDTPAETLDMIAVDGAASWQLSIPNLPQKFHGTGDILAALFLDAWLISRDTGAALGKACSALQGVLALTAAQSTGRKADEPLLIEAQNLLAAPQLFFVPERIS
jgi:pyridoxine kinase